LENNFGLILLDIKMPGVSGVEVARSLKDLDNPPQLVFTTAYNQYAIEAFRLAAVDYLLKPMSKERFKETLLVLKNEIKINWDIGEYKNANITKNKPSINQLSPEILDIITKKNQNDIKLYKFANKLLDEKLKKLDK
jgi:two-component system LytT family response regulator/two-component system response regulator LytT